jgi:hypothetical protein
MKVRNEVELKTCHDIRHLAGCATCSGVGDDRRMLKFRGGLHHGACLVEQVDRKHLLKMPTEELNKLTLGDAGVPFIKAMLKVLEKRNA